MYTGLSFPAAGMALALASFWFSIFLVSAFFWCQHFSGVSIFLVSAFFWCLVSAFF
jgi:hypothetical protein